MKIKFNFLSMLLTLVIAGLLSSCSNPTKGLLKQIPADTDIVAVGNLKEVMKSAGGKIDGSKVVLPELLDKLPVGEIDELVEKVEESGANVEACAVFGNFDGKEVCAIKLEDEKKFVSFIEEEMNLDEDGKEGKISFYTNIYDDYYSDSSYGVCIAIVGDYAYYYTGEEPKEYLSEVIAAAKKKNYAKTKAGKYIAKGNVGGFAVRFPEELVEEIKEDEILSEYVSLIDGAYICVRGKLKKEEVIAEFQYMNKDGKKVDGKDFEKLGINPKAKVSKKALKFMSEKEQLVYAVSLEGIDWDKVWEKAEMAREWGMISRSDMDGFNMVKDYVSKLDGTIAMGVGFTGDVEEAVEAMNDEDFSVVHVTMVVEVKDKKTAEGLLNDVADLLELAADYDEVDVKITDNGIALKSRELSTTFYGEVHDNALVFSTHKIEKKGDSPALDAIDFTDYTAAAAIALPKEHKIMKDLGIESTLALSLGGKSKDQSGVIKFSVKDAEGKGFVEKVVNVGLDAAKGAQKLEKKISRSRYDGYRY